MSTIQLHYGPIFSQLCRSYLQNIEAQFQHSGQIIYLTNNERRATFLRRKYLLKKTGDTAQNLPFISKGKWLELLWDKLNIQGTLLDNFEMEWLIRNIISSGKVSFDTYQYDRENFPDSVISEIFRQIQHLRLNPSTPAVQGSKKDGDIWRLLSLYSKMIADKYVDRADYIGKIQAQLTRETIQTIYPGVKKIVWENGSDLNEVPLNLLKKLAGMGITVEILLPCDDNKLFYQHRRVLWAQLKTIAGEAKYYPPAGNYYNLLFNYSGRQASLTNHLKIVKSSNLFEEVDSLIGKVLTLQQEKQIAPHKIAVCYFNRKQYQPHLEAKFGLHKIPFSRQTGIAFNQSIVIQNLELLIRFIENDYDLDIAAEIITSPYFKFSGHKNINAIMGNLQNFRVRRGKARILSYLHHIISSRQEGQKNIWNEIRTLLQQIFQLVSFLEKPADAGSYFGTFTEILISNGIPDKILELGRNSGFAHIQKEANSLNGFAVALQKWAKLESEIYPGRQIKFIEFARIFRTIAKTGRATIRYPRNFGIQLTSPQNVIHENFDYVFVLGATENASPSGMARMDGQTHSQADDSLRQISEEREFFLQLINCANKEISFSSPSFDQDRPVLPSPFLREILRIVPDNLLQERNIYPISPAELCYQQVFATETSGTPTSDNKLSHQTKVIHSRRKRAVPGTFEGHLSEDQIIPNFLADKLREHRYSPTKLERFARCPFIYWAEAWLKYPAPEVADEQFTPLDRGQIIHNTLYRFYRELSAKERNIARLKKIALEEIEKMHLPDNLMQELEKLYFTGNVNQSGLMDLFWESEEAQNANYQSDPKYFEFSFGLSLSWQNQYDPLSTPMPFVYKKDGRKYYFKGKIDRIEITPANELLVVDYKTGSPASFKEMLNGKKLQLPLYLLAAQHFLSGKQPAIPAAGIFYKLSKPVEKKISFRNKYVDFYDGQKISVAVLPGAKAVIDEHELGMDEFLKSVLDQMIQYIQKIESADFSHTTEEKNCVRCSYRALCLVQPDKQAYLRETAEQD